MAAHRQRSLTSEDIVARMLARGLDEKFLDAIEEGLQATQHFWSKEKDDWVEKPDHQVRTRVLMVAAPYLFPKPERSIKVTTTDDAEIRRKESDKQLKVATEANAEFFIQRLQEVIERRNAKAAKLAQPAADPVFQLANSGDGEPNPENG